MSATYIIIDRKTPMLLPPDLREWVASDDMVHFVIKRRFMTPQSPVFAP